MIGVAATFSRLLNGFVYLNAVKKVMERKLGTADKKYTILEMKTNQVFCYRFNLDNSGVADQKFGCICFFNGDSIPEAKTEREWKKARLDGKPAWCYYDNDPVKGRKYGKLYNWYAVNDPRGLCPEGWRIPFDNERSDFIRLVGKEAGNGKYSLYASEDNGETFKKRSDELFEKRPYKKNFYYITGNVLDDGRFIFYSYQGEGQNLPYVISEYGGYTWSEVKMAFMEKMIRVGQMSDKIGDYYFMTGRSSNNSGDDPRCTVLYASKDGINWDRGRFLNKIQLGMDSYSANEVIGKYNPSTKKRLLIQADNGYSGYARVNVKHWWIENIEGCQ
jgi:uncharacterized protein (TIGR02145 family)